MTDTFNKTKFRESLLAAFRESKARYRQETGRRFDASTEPCPHCNGANETSYFVVGRRSYGFSIRDAKGAGIYLCGSSNRSRCPNYVAKNKKR